MSAAIGVYMGKMAIVEIAGIGRILGIVLFLKWELGN